MTPWGALSTVAAAVVAAAAVVVTAGGGGGGGGDGDVEGNLISAKVHEQCFKIRTFFYRLSLKE